MALKEPHDAYLTPGFDDVVIGTPAVDDGNLAFLPGTLTGMVDHHQAVILLFYEGDTPAVASGTVEFLIEGVDVTWRDAPVWRHARNANAFASSIPRHRCLQSLIPHLMPNQTYRIRVNVSSPHGQNVVDVETTFRTPRIPNLPTGGTVVDCFVPGDYDNAALADEPGKTIVLHGSTAYVSPNLGGRGKGSFDFPMVIRRNPGDSPTLDQVSAVDAADHHLWVHDVELTDRYHSQQPTGANDFTLTRVINHGNDFNESRPFQILGDRQLFLDCEGSRALDSGPGTREMGDIFEHSNSARDITILFAHAFQTNDPFSRGGGLSGGEYPYTGNYFWGFAKVEECSDDFGELDGMTQPIFMYGNIGGNRMGRRMISTQGQDMPYFFLIRNQWTGSINKDGVLGWMKAEGQLTAGVIMGNVIQHGDTTQVRGSAARLFGEGGEHIGDVSPSQNYGGGRNTVFSLNVLIDPENPNLGFMTGQPAAGDPMYGWPEDFDHNSWFLTSGQVFQGMTLAQLQAEGVSANDIMDSFANVGNHLENWNADVPDYNVGTTKSLFPADGKLLGNNTGRMVGFKQVWGPWSQSQPNRGMNDRILKFWNGPRQLTGWNGQETRQVHGVPVEYTHRDPTTATDAKYTGLGLPSSHTAVRLLLDRNGPSTPDQAIVVDFELIHPSARWQRYGDWINGVGLSSPVLVEKWDRFGTKGAWRDGIGVAWYTVGSQTIWRAAIHENGGLALVTAASDTANATVPVMREWSAFTWSLYNNYGQLEPGDMPAPPPATEPPRFSPLIRAA